ncbi:aminoglycoside phosphotransferase family protein [Saccharomonospora sp. NPDC006951]
MSALGIPPAFARLIREREGAEGAAWIAALPELVRAFCLRWNLTVEGKPLHGQVGLVVPVRSESGPAMLKLSWRDTESRDEPAALAAWAGAGAVLLRESDPGHGAMLLERLDENRMLSGEPIDRAVAVAADLLRSLTIPAPALTRNLRDEARRWTAELPREWERLGRPLPRVLLTAAVDICERRGPHAARLLVNEDLHYENVLAGTRAPWLVIDPKPLEGDPEFAVIPLLWNRIGESGIGDRFAAIVAGADLDAGLAREWTLVRAVVNWLWAVEEEPRRQGGSDWLGDAVREIALWAHRTAEGPRVT